MGGQARKPLLSNTYPYPPENNRLGGKYGGQTFRPQIFYPHFPPDSYPLAYFVQPLPLLATRSALCLSMYVCRPTRPLPICPYICIHYKYRPYPLPYPIAPLYVLQYLYIDREDRQTTLETQPERLAHRPADHRPSHRLVPLAHSPEPRDSSPRIHIS